VDKTKKRILIVDDDKDILESIKEILEADGYRLDTAENGCEAIEKAKNNFYNMALLDIKLPDMEGTELLTQLPATTPKMMKVIITGYPSQDNAIRSLNLGADAYLTKPIWPEKLLEVVENKLREQEEIEEMSQAKMDELIQARIRRLEKEHGL